MIGDFLFFLCLGGWYYVNESEQMGSSAGRIDPEIIDKLECSIG